MIPRHLGGIALACLFLMTTVAAHAQGPDPLEIKVLDGHGKPISGMSVELDYSNIQDGKPAHHSGKTDSNGLHSTTVDNRIEIKVKLSKSGYSPDPFTATIPANSTPGKARSATYSLNGGPSPSADPAKHPGSGSGSAEDVDSNTNRTEFLNITVTDRKTRKALSGVKIELKAASGSGSLPRCANTDGRGKSHARVENTISVQVKATRSGYKAASATVKKGASGKARSVTLRMEKAGRGGGKGGGKTERTP